MERTRKTGKGWPFALWLLPLVAGLGLLVWMVVARLEGGPPVVVLDAPSPWYLGKTAEVALELSDPKSGLRRFSATLTKDGKETVLAESEFPATGFLSLSNSRKETARLRIDPGALGLSDGKAVLRVMVWDRSWRNWWHGNAAELKREVVIDTKPPVIEVVTREHYLNQGGTGLVVYRLSEECPRSGVRVGSNFFPGYSGYYTDRSLQIAFFALGHQQGPGTEIVLEAADPAGNAAAGRFYHHIRKKAFKKDRLTVSNEFITQILPEFQPLLPNNPGATLKDRFLYINRDQRRLDYEKMVELTRRTHTMVLWKGPFLRLPNAAPRAGFADHRTYLYEGREIDQQDHLGVDLASLTHAEVPAANSGVVIFAGTLGIYGKTVVLDHGFGLFSMYSHLSQVSVNANDRVAREQVLGNTGSTGLAGGDHLHFSIMVHNTFVDPVEWWDPAWIINNITSKLEAAKPAGG